MKIQKNYKFNKSIFRAYDIRGIIAETLNVIDAYLIGYNFALQIKNKHRSANIIVGYDGRLSSPILEKKLVLGLSDAGANIIKIGMSTSPMLYYSLIKLKADGAIMITGSHNPSNYNGFKILSKDGSYFGKQIHSLSVIKSNLILEGKVSNYDISNSYIGELLNSVSLDKKEITVVWDPGNGVTGNLLNKLIKHLQGNHIIINSEVDGTFPSHHPDPTKEKNLVDIRKAIKENKADIGIAFDGDGDRIGVVSSKGILISGDKLLLLYAIDILKNNKNSKIIGDVKVSNFIFKEIDRLGGKSIMYKTGHSLIKTKMKETKAILAGEMSGHIFFSDRYYGFDDAMYAAIRLLNILSKGFDIEKFLDKFNKLYSTPEVNIYCDDNLKFKIIEKIKKIISKKHEKVSFIDGIRVTYPNGWWLIRASNTQPAIIIRCESNSQKNLDVLIKEVRSILFKFDLTVEVLNKFNI
jgi:phosphomannomutase